ncbi:MAG TPA: hypothetical protein VIQ24_04855 [Pyrinomonadaceae bacterium]
MKLRILAIFIVVLCLVLLAREASADSNVTFKNDSGRTLHIYYASASNGTTIDCGSLTYGGVFNPSATWSYSVGPNRWGWVRFQLDTQNAGCSSNNNKFETRIAGSAESRSETVSVQ